MRRSRTNTAVPTAKATNTHGQRRGSFSTPTLRLTVFAVASAAFSNSLCFLTAILRAFFALLRALRVDFSAAAITSARRASSSLRALSTPAASVSFALSRAGATASRAATARGTA